jgi:hypothetical protein
MTVQTVHKCSKIFNEIKHSLTPRGDLGGDMRGDLGLPATNYTIGIQNTSTKYKVQVLIKTKSDQSIEG